MRRLLSRGTSAVDAVSASEAFVRGVLSRLAGRASGPSTAPTNRTDSSPVAEQGTPRAVPASLVVLVYELLDAHTDTAELASRLPYDPSWATHVDYLRGLQRKGRETLAQLGAEGPV